MPSESVLERLRKLIAHEKSARTIGSIHEAEAFAARIQAIMYEHKLGMSDVEFAEREAGEPIGWEYVNSEDRDFPYQSSRREWQVRLANCIAYCNQCQVVLASRQGNALSFVGRTSDREYCKVFFIYMLRLAIDLNELAVAQDTGEQKFKYVHSLQPWQDYNLGAFRAWMKDWAQAWFNGFGSAVCLRLYTRNREMKEKAESSSNAMVHLAKDIALVRQYLKGKTKNTSGGRSNGRNEDGYRRGKRAGQAVNLSPSVFANTSGRTARLLGG